VASCSEPVSRTWVGTQLWLWPNLLSLDAPLVAVLWQILFARCFHASPDSLPAVLLVLAVWLIYAADRALDAWSGNGRLPRHEFYRRHWKSVLPLWVTVLAFTTWLASAYLPAVLFHRGLALLAAIGIYFGIVHLAPERIRRVWPKEAAVAVLFALGASIATWTKVQSTADTLSILLFSCLCWINCVAIEHWENERWQSAGWSRQAGDEPKEVGAFLGLPIGVAALFVGVAALLFLSEHRPVIGGAETASALAFVWLDRARRRLSADALRVLADVALLSPIFFLPLAGMRF